MGWFWFGVIAEFASLFHFVTISLNCLQTLVASS
jgi:hypothetical protein